jgi:sialic acid synthase SpsE/quercetin dioxygenase-like cupin family protein
MKIPTDKPLFIFEMANNHMGSVEHGLKIIREMNEASKDFDFHFAFKFQFRHLDTFIHPDFKGRSDVKYVKRFSETRLNKEEFKKLKKEADSHRFISICTPFDEPSVEMIEELGFDIIKVASCSFTDWPLLERIVKSDKPIIASTAGASIDAIDKVVSFLEHRQKNFALMHCVAEYPTAIRNINLNQIDLLRLRYPHVSIGYSTHEHPDNTDAVKMAIAKGVTIHEKHVGVPTESIILNNYSASPAQVRKWLTAAKEAFEICGISGKRYEFSKDELGSLEGLRRGAFAKRNIKKGEKITADDIFLAIPLADGQITANDLSKYNEFIAQNDVEINKPILFSNVSSKDNRQKVYEIVQRVNTLLAKSGVVTPQQADFEISHHYGIDRFDEFGITMITVVNRDYCKKLIIVLPGQNHPEQYHKQKEETFYILYGDVILGLNGVEKEYRKGDVIVVEAGVKHIFRSKSGAVIEEISTTHFKDDSYYTDPEILKNKNRKTFLTNWMDLGGSRG